MPAPYVERDGKLYRPDGTEIEVTRLPAGNWDKRLSSIKPARKSPCAVSRRKSLTRNPTKAR